MNIEKANGLVALVSYGAPDVWLHGNPNATLFNSPPLKRTTNSQFTFLSQDFTYNEDDNIYSVTIPTEVNRPCELVGKCYLSIQTKSDIDIDPQNLYDIVNSVSVCFNANTCESLYGSTLKVTESECNSSAKAELMCGESHNIMIPLPFFFTKSTDKYIPLSSLSLTEVSFRAKLNLQHIDVQSMRFVYQGIYLDTDERRKLVNEPKEIVTIGTKTCTHTIQCTKDSDEEYVMHTIPLDYNHRVKDIRVLLEQRDDNSQEEPVGLLNITLNGHTHMSLNSMMARKIIPRQFYKLENEKPLYYIPFCHDPLSLTHVQTSDINFGRVDKANLVIHIKPGNYKVTLVARHYNILRIKDGEYGFAFLP